MSRDDLRTITSTDPSSSDDNWTAVTGTDKTVGGTPKRALDTCIVNGAGDPVPVSGTVSQSDLITGGKVTLVTLSAVAWTLLPPTALPGRRQMIIVNDSGVAIKLNYDTTTALPVGFVGTTLADGFERHYQAQDTFLVYAKAASGTPSITVEELL